MSDSTTPTVDLTGLPPEQAFALGQLIHDLLADAREAGYRRAIADLCAGSGYEDWCAATGRHDGSRYDHAAYLEAIADAHSMTPTTEAATAGVEGAQR